MRHFAKDVLLIDKSDVVCGVWDYLIKTSVQEIERLPDIYAGESVDDLPICQEAKWLIGFWCNNGAASPCKTPSPWAAKQTQHHKNWNTLGRARCALQAPLIRHWKILRGSYQDAPDVRATWFIDPPYQGKQGSYYPFGSALVDYTDLGEWCLSRSGQVIVCEGIDANWLPFSSFGMVQGSPGARRNGKGMEMVWTNE